MASLQGSKSASRVNEQESAGSKEAGMGENRVSSKADVREYVARPDASGIPSKVPMQPLSDLWPDRDIVFQVTKSGYDCVTETREA